MHRRWTSATMAVVVTALVAACSAGATMAPSATPGISSRPSLFTGRAVCRDVPAPSGASDALYIECDTTASDPRIVGTPSASENHGTAGGSVATYWNSFAIENTDGSWSCKGLVIGSSETGMGWEDDVCVGEGGYHGLTAYMHQISGDMWTWSFVGWIDETP